MDWQKIDTYPKERRHESGYSRVLVWYRDWGPELSKFDGGWYVLNNGDYGYGGYGNDYDTRYGMGEASDGKPLTPTHWMKINDPV